MKSTSRSAYETIRDNGLLTESRWQVYDAVHRGGRVTGNDVDRMLSSPSAHKRLSELQVRGLIRVVGMKIDDHTGHENELWEVVPEAVPVEPVMPAAKTDKPKRPSKLELAKAVAELRVRYAKAKEAGVPFSPELEATCKWLRYYAER